MVSADNGFLGFDQYRIPRENMLMRNSQVVERKKQRKDRLTYSFLNCAEPVFGKDLAEKKTWQSSKRSSVETLIYVGSHLLVLSFGANFNPVLVVRGLQVLPSVRQSAHDCAGAGGRHVREAREGPAELRDHGDGPLRHRRRRHQDVQEGRGHRRQIQRG